MEIPGSEGWHVTVLLAVNRWVNLNSSNSPSMGPSEGSVVLFYGRLQGWQVGVNMTLNKVI
jgi:hypothetical protein